MNNDAKLLLQDADAAVRAASPLAFFPLARGFWHGRTAVLAWSLSGGLLALVIVNVVVQVMITRWHASFFNALEQRHADRLIAGISQLAVLTLAAALVAALIVWLRMRLQIAWRGWLSEKLIAMWLRKQRFARLPTVAPQVDAPEFRIAQDVQVAVEPLVEFAVGLANSLLSATAFITILWTVGGAITLPFGGGWVIPGFMVWVAIAYAILSSGLIAVLGRPLIHAIERKNAVEAALRGNMVKVREEADAIARSGEEATKQKLLTGLMRRVVTAWNTIAALLAKLTILINANVTLMPVVPLLACAPLYLNSSMPLGSMMQIAAAFVQTQFAFNWFFDNFIRIADWEASARRVVGLRAAFADSDRSADEPAGSAGDEPSTRPR
ncbi:MAG: putative ABC transporter (fused ATP-binding and permease components) [Xanthobacteraceae bacterium]|nr:MAG: putative ABC transporter (fused ATP-binding and permease components) [Xanthobacteraceae bacterium]